ncbi:MAG: NAD(P)-dependent alcohol dehydrogenase [Halioglobus sp.]
MKFRYKVATALLFAIVSSLSALALTVGYTSACEPAANSAPSAATMKAISYRCYGPPAVLEYNDIPRPEPGDTELLVKVASASVNPTDWHYMRGSPYLLRLMSGIGAPQDSRLGVDFAGTVEAVGNMVAKFKVGDRVYGGTTGAFAEYLTVDQSRSVSPVPDDISLAQASSVPIAGVSALQALRDKGGLKPGQKVLINGASGGVGTFAVQIAKAMGAEVSGVCSTRNIKLVKSIGADHVFDYTRENYTENDKKYDLIIDNVGNHSLLANRSILTPNGRLVIVGGAKGNWIAPLITPIKAMIISPFFDQKFLSLFAKMNQQDLTILAEMMDSGAVVPVIDVEYPLAEAADAIAYSESGRARGKILLTM